MNGPWRVPSGRPQNHVGSGDGASFNFVPTSQASRGGGPAWAGAASTDSGGTTGRGASAGALFGPLDPEPQAEPIVKIKARVDKRSTLILLHKPDGIHGGALL